MEKMKGSMKGRTTYNNNIVTNIVTLAVSEVEGVAPSVIENADRNANPEKFLQKIKLDFDGNNVFVDLSVYVFEGYAVPDVAFKIQETVKNSIENMTTFKTTSVDVRVLGVVLRNQK